MYTILLVDCDYSYAMKLKRQLELEKWNASLSIEYCTAGAEMKIKVLNPHILILGHLLWGNAPDMVQTAKECSRCMKAVVLDETANMYKMTTDSDFLCIADEMHIKEAVEQALLCTQDTHTSNEACNLDKNIHNTQHLGVDAALNTILQRLENDNAVYLTRVKIPLNTNLAQMEELCHAIFQDLYLGFFLESEESVCIAIVDGVSKSILYSITVVSELFVSFYAEATANHISIAPILISERGNLQNIMGTYQQLNRLEQYLYFFPQSKILTMAQVLTTEQPLEFSQVSGYMDQLLGHLLIKDYARTQQTLSQLYYDYLMATKNTMMVKYIREQLCMVFRLLNNVELHDWRSAEEMFADCTNIQHDHGLIQKYCAQYCKQDGEAGQSHVKTVQALRYIIAHYTENIAMEDVANDLQISPSYFSRIFKRCMGVGFVDYLNALRMANAKSLIQSGATNVVQLAHGVGFADARYFSRVFKQYFGMSPSAYITQHQIGETT